MIDDDTRARAKAYTDSFNEGDAPAAEKTDLTAAGAEYTALKDQSEAEFSNEWNAPAVDDVKTSSMTTPGTTESKDLAPLAMAAPEPVKALSFKETFAARRKAGDATFEWNGKKYTTDLKKPVASTTVKVVAPVAKTPAATPAAPATSVTQKLGSDYAAVKSAADRMPVGTSDAARSALNEDVARRQRAYEQAATAEKSSTSLTQKLGSDYAAVKSAADRMPVGTSPAARQALNTMVSANQRTYEQAAAAEKAAASGVNGRIPYSP